MANEDFNEDITEGFDEDFQDFLAGSSDASQAVGQLLNQLRGEFFILPSLLKDQLTLQQFRGSDDGVKAMMAILGGVSEHLPALRDMLPKHDPVRDVSMFSLESFITKYTNLSRLVNEQMFQTAPGLTTLLLIDDTQTQRFCARCSALLSEDPVVSLGIPVMPIAFLYRALRLNEYLLGRLPYDSLTDADKETIKLTFGRCSIYGYDMTQFDRVFMDMLQDYAVEDLLRWVTSNLVVFKVDGSQADDLAAPMDRSRLDRLRGTKGPTILDDSTIYDILLIRFNTVGTERALRDLSRLLLLSVEMSSPLETRPVADGIGLPTLDILLWHPSFYDLTLYRIDLLVAHGLWDNPAYREDTISHYAADKEFSQRSLLRMSQLFMSLDIADNVMQRMLFDALVHIDRSTEVVDVVAGLVRYISWAGGKLRKKPEVALHLQHIAAQMVLAGVVPTSLLEHSYPTTVSGCVLEHTEQAIKWLAPLFKAYAIAENPATQKSPVDIRELNTGVIKYSRNDDIIGLSDLLIPVFRWLGSLYRENKRPNIELPKDLFAGVLGHV